MNRSQLILALAKAADVPSEMVEAVVDALPAVVGDAVAAGDRVQMPGFATVTAVERSARQGRNPSTGQPISIPAKRVVKFSPASRLKDVVARG